MRRSAIAMLIAAALAACSLASAPRILGAPEPVDSAIATTPLDELLTRFAADDESAAPVDPPPTQAGYAYARARLAFLDRSFEEAAALLERAEQLAPGDPAIPATLAEVHLALGERPKAAAAFARAVARGNLSPRVLLAAAIDANDARRSAEASEMLARALAQDGVDPGLRRLVHASLATALDRQGYALAAAESAIEALRDRSPEPTQYAAQLETLERQRPSLWAQTASMFLRAGQHRDAIDAWHRASDGLGAEGLFAGRIARSELALGDQAAASATIASVLTDPRATLDDDLIAIAASLTDQQSRQSIVQAAQQALLDDPSPSSPHIRSWLTRLGAAASDDPLLVLGERLDADPFDLRSTRALFSLLSPGQAAQVAAERTQRYPEALVVLGEALTTAHPDALELLEALAPLDTPASAMLSARLLLSLEREQDAADMLAGSPPGDSAAWHATVAVIAAASGDFATAREAAEAIDAEAHPHFAIEAFTAAGLRASALAVPTDAPPIGAVRAARLAKAGLAARFGTPATETILLDLLRADPFDPDAAAALLSVYANAGQTGQARASSIVEQLNRIAPSATETRLGVARAVGDQQPAEAQRLLQLAFERTPARTGVLDELITLWTTNDPANSLRSGRQWLEQQLEQRPPSTALIRTTARVRGMLGDRAAARALLEQHLARPDASRALEAMLLADPQTRSEGAAVRSRRLALRADGITARIERLAAAAQSADGPIAAALAGVRSIPPSFELLPVEQAPLFDALARLAARVANAPEAEEIAGTLDTIGWVSERFGGLPAQLAQLRVPLLALREPFDAELVAAEARSLESGAWAAVAETLFRLNALERFDRVLALGDRLAAEQASPDALGQLAIAISEVGTIEHARRWLELMPAADDRARTLAALGVGQFEQMSAQAPERLGATLLNLLAVRMQTLGRDEPAIALLRLAHEFTPDDAVLANNLAYSLAELGLDLPRAAALAEGAVATEPDNASFVDTLGWVRYRQGRFAEAFDLLSRADALGPGSMETARQLGDVLWQLGRRSEAVQQWKRAQDLADAEAERAETGPGPRRAAIARDRAAIDARLEAVESGKPPPVPGVVR